ncbi:CRISPR-associated endonuclease Cas2 [Flammeovirga agarivorans]|uniref:CRISPR-associated endoribonuclease Cas2 n=1 Tax=Flammeovirga agarivorans TaxID=2726742 RepID=A0A7X8XYH7_9BACT|nr:CRISPR-associated endonuclease Cas2 [Flammeovirga agarivorans]NLR94040.1 CRISPR-associated endonuclease Cas2 [Flammeovirga agarivorans]
MYIILVYDINTKRGGKMLKLCRKYLNWIQNSVFEGELTNIQLENLKADANEIMQEGDSLIIFNNKSKKWLNKEIIGQEKSSINNFL